MKHYVSFSGGKDSTAMLLLMIEKNMPITEILFADTKYEFPEMYEHINAVEKHIGRSITRLRTDQDMEDWFYGEWTSGKYKGQIRGFPMITGPCYWSRESKFNMLNKYCKGHHRYIGIAWDESHRVTSNTGYHYPLVDWRLTERDCIQICKDHGLYPPVIAENKRTGCWWCPKQSIRSLEYVYRNYPEYWEQMKKWEADSPGGFHHQRKLTKLERRFAWRQLRLWNVTCAAE